MALTSERVGNPPFYGQLLQMGFEAAVLPRFSLMAAITFPDTVVSHEAFTDRLLFRELVDALANPSKPSFSYWTTNTSGGFLSGGSYEAILLEMNAYELDRRSAEMPTRVFSVADEVQRWIRADRF